MAFACGSALVALPTLLCADSPRLLQYAVVAKFGCLEDFHGGIAAQVTMMPSRAILGFECP